jgi:transposase InsO family protein
VHALHEIHGYPIQPACELMDLSRSRYYYRSRKAAEDLLEGQILQVIGQFPRYGTRRVAQQLQRSPYSLQINRKRVQRIMRSHGWLRKAKWRGVRTTRSGHPFPRYPNLVKELVVVRPDQLWAADITYIRLGEGFVYLAVVLDVYTRMVRGWNLSASLDQELSLAALRMALAKGIPQIHHSDQGFHYAAYAYTGLLKTHGIAISMASVGKAEENGYAERLMRTIKEEEVDLSDYRDLAEAQAQIGRFLEDVYNRKRIHSSLRYLTPLEFEEAYRISAFSDP